MKDKLSYKQMKKSYDRNYYYFLESLSVYQKYLVLQLIESNTPLDKVKEILGVGE